MNTEIAKRITEICVKCLRTGGKIFFCGNGGSATDAQHLAAELVGKLNFDRPPLAAIALTSDIAIITAIANDYGYEFVFSRQINALANAGDVLIAMSTSGNSKNVLNAISMAAQLGVIVIGKTGLTGGAMTANEDCSLVFHSISNDTQRIQEEHMHLGHIYCGMIEKEIFA